MDKVDFQFSPKKVDLQFECPIIYSCILADHTICTIHFYTRLMHMIFYLFTSILIPWEKTIVWTFSLDGLSLILESSNLLQKLEDSPYNNSHKHTCMHPPMHMHTCACMYTSTNKQMYIVAHMDFMVWNFLLPKVRVSQRSKQIVTSNWAT